MESSRFATVHPTFQIGGLYTVRGYTEGLLQGDSGYSFSAEYDVPLTSGASTPGRNPFTDKWRAFVFIDHGGTFPFKGDGASGDSDDYLTSLGFGFRMNLGNVAQGRIVVGFPLFQRDDKEEGVRVHFYLQSLGK